jgi:uncharacterized membrane protein YidH (DUF202 family)
MNAARIIGLVLVAIGIVLLVIGINATQSTGEQFRQSFVGKYSQNTTLYIIAGVAGIVGGGALTLWGGRMGISHR